MKFLVDGNLPLSLVEFLRSKRFVAYRLVDVGLKGAGDSEIASYAFRNKLILITSDKDFGIVLRP